MTLVRTFSAAALIVTLAACGNSQGDRALSGAGIGAGAGAVGSAVLGADPVTGAVVGGAVGAATGALTDKDDLDMGDAPWNR